MIIITDTKGAAMKIALTGSNGYVGHLLKVAFPDYIAIGRDESVESIISKLEDVDVVINLAGATILKRWTAKHKRSIYESRIQTTRKLVQAINQSRVKHFISTSAIGIYASGSAADESSKDEAGDYLATVVNAWEAEAIQANCLTTILRFGVILGRNGGALQKMLLPFVLGIGGPIGRGDMMMSWIHEKDLVKIYRHIIEHEIEGVINATAPNPVSNARFTKALAKVLRRPAFLPLPPFVLRLIYGEGAGVLLESKEVYPKVLTDIGFRFDYAHIDHALADILAKA